MQNARPRWLLALTLALTLAAPGLSRGEIAPGAGVAEQRKGEASSIQVIRSVKVSEAYPAEAARTTSVATNTMRSKPIRSSPIRLNTGKG